VRGSRRLAEKAVKDVYQFCASRNRKKPGSYRNFMLDTRELIAERFRNEHGSSGATPGLANVYPYFIGVFDTVAALGRTAAVIGLTAAFIALMALISFVVSLLTGLHDVSHYDWLKYLTFGNVYATLSATAGAASVIIFLRNYVKYDFSVPGYGFWKSLATIHLAPRKQKFYDYTLNKNVEYAKHAISIDENRRDFKRVPWQPDAVRDGTRDQLGNIHFEQVWFSGVHADVGGGYPENESRLSDIALKWMLDAASIIPNDIKHDPSVLTLHPDPAGPQHDECKAGHWQHGPRVLPADMATGITSATIHRSVYARFAAKEVVQYDQMAAYRPANLEKHIDFAHYYSGSPAPVSFAAEADNIESRMANRATDG
jgi:hypothetical protein